MKSKLNVTIIYKVFNHYRKPIFDELNRYFNLTVLHSLNETWVKSAKANYSKFVNSFSYGKKPTQVWLFVENKILINKPHVIIHEFTPSLISLYTTFLISKILNIKFIIWGHGYNKSVEFNHNSLIMKVRFFFMKRSDAIILYGERDKQFLSNYINSNKLFIAQNTLDTEKLTALRDQFEEIGKLKVKEELGIRYKFNIIYIGRLLQEKNPDVILELNKLFIMEKIDIGIHFIGDGEYKTSLMKKCNENNFGNVHFYGEVHSDNITGKYLFASDLMVMPGYLGLSVNHSLCFDCPVVSFKQGPEGPYHSPEVEYVLNNKTGYLAKTGDVKDMKDWINNYLNDKNLQRVMKKEIKYSVIYRFPKRKMVQGILDAIEYSLIKKR